MYLIFLNLEPQGYCPHGHEWRTRFRLSAADNGGGWVGQGKTGGEGGGGLNTSCKMLNPKGRYSLFRNIVSLFRILGIYASSSLVPGTPSCGCQDGRDSQPFSTQPPECRPFKGSFFWWLVGVSFRECCV